MKKKSQAHIPPHTNIRLYTAWVHSRPIIFIYAYQSHELQFFVRQVVCLCKSAILER